MTTYILKVIGCSGLLLLIYHPFLEKEKMHRFNRFYLLFAIVFSFITPLVHIPSSIPEVLVSKMPYSNELIAFSPSASQNNIIKESTIHWSIVILGIYCLVSVGLLIRFIVNIFTLLITIKKSEIIGWQNSKLVLIDNCLTTYSFFGYLFLNREAYKEGKIEQEIFEHELAHISQKHSWDILFIEFLLIFAWPNLILFFYRKAIRLNHEFLADERVVQSFDLHHYQNLLLTEPYMPDDLILSSSFNYLLTKKRLIMMTKKTPLSLAIAKQITIVLFIVATFALFSKNAIAQTNDLFESASNKIGVSNELMEEYQNIINKYTHEGKKWHLKFAKEVTKEDLEQLRTIFSKMNKEQISKQTIVFVPAPSLLKITPSQDQLNSWRDSKIYGVWIDGKRVKNSALNKYSPSDFSHLSISPLMKNATNYGKYYFQVDLMTNDFYTIKSFEIAGGPKSLMAFAIRNDNYLDNIQNH